MRVCFYTLGCKVNLNETGALEQMFRGAGFTIVPEGEEADVVVNSCTVTNFGDQKSRKWLRRAKRENPGAVTVLTGCYPQAFPEEAAQFMEADLVCGNGDRKAILDNVLKLLDGRDMYGYQIIEELACRSNNVFQMKAGTLYPLLHGLEKKGLLESYEEHADSARVRKYYRLTQKGKKFLQEKTDEFLRRQQNSGRRSLL